MHLPPPSPPEGSVICPYSDPSTLSAFGFRDTAMFRISPTRHRQIRFLGQIDPTSCGPCSNSILKTLGSTRFLCRDQPFVLTYHRHNDDKIRVRLARSNTPATTTHERPLDHAGPRRTGRRGGSGKGYSSWAHAGLIDSLTDLRKAPPKVRALTHDCECIFTLSPLARR